MRFFGGGTLSFTRKSLGSSGLKSNARTPSASWPMDTELKIFSILNVKMKIFSIATINPLFFVSRVLFDARPGYNIFEGCLLFCTTKNYFVDFSPWIFAIFNSVIQTQAPCWTTPRKRQHASSPPICQKQKHFKYRFAVDSIEWSHPT